MRQLFALSGRLDTKNELVLIGILTELTPGTVTRKGEYRFEYKLGGKFRRPGHIIPEFQNPSRVYTGDEVYKFIHRLIPSRNSIYLQEALESAGMTEYNEWELLKVMSLRCQQNSGYLYEELPRGITIYENL